jgi:2-phosphosulfolactate phosphatase
VYAAHLGLVDDAYRAAETARAGPSGSGDDVMGPDRYRTALMFQAAMPELGNDRRFPRRCARLGRVEFWMAAHEGVRGLAEALSEWGMAGLEALCEHVGVLVIVDVLSFSTAVDVAVSRGAIVYPFPFVEEKAALFAAEHVGALLARPRRAAGGEYSLSPVSLASIPSGTRLMLPSLNGSRLSVVAGRTKGRIPVLTGCLRNARAVAAAAWTIAGGRSIGVIPAGERWRDGSLRPAIEDLLGAGAILDYLNWPCSPEAQVARDAYRAAEHEIARLIRLSVSGRELVDAGYSGDVDLALEQGASTTVPVLMEGAYRGFS